MGWSYADAMRIHVVHAPDPKSCFLCKGHRQRSKRVLEGEAAGLGQVDCPHGPQDEWHHMSWAPCQPVLVPWTPVRVCYLYSFEWDQHTSSAFINTTSHVPRSRLALGPYTPPANHFYVPPTSSPWISEVPLDSDPSSAQQVFFSHFEETPTWETLSLGLKK